MNVVVSYSEIMPDSKLMGPFHFTKRHWHPEETRPPRGQIEDQERRPHFDCGNE
jgi:hypothetical protein